MNSTQLGQPKNEWTCDEWPGIMFVMPQTQYVDMREMSVRAVASRMVVPPEMLDADRGGRNG